MNTRVEEGIPDRPATTILQLYYGTTRLYTVRQLSSSSLKKESYRPTYTIVRCALRVFGIRVRSGYSGGGAVR